MNRPGTGSSRSSVHRTSASTAQGPERPGAALMSVWTAQRSRDEAWDLLDVTATLDDAQQRCLADATPYKPFLDPRPQLPVLTWRRSYLAEDALDQDEQT